MKKKTKGKPEPDDQDINSSPVCYAENKDLRPEYQLKQEEPTASVSKKKPKSGRKG